MTTSERSLTEVLEPALAQVLEEMYFCTPESHAPVLPEGPLLGAELPFSALASDSAESRLRPGVFRLLVTERLAVQMAAEFLAVTPGEVSKEQAEAMISELTNVACGAVLSAWLPGTEFRLTLPRKFEALADSQPLEHCFSVMCGSGSPDLAELAVGIEFLKIVEF